MTVERRPATQADLDAVELNPQPLPPGGDPAAAVELNPQPLPPVADRFFEEG